MSRVNKRKRMAKIRAYHAKCEKQWHNAVSISYSRSCMNAVCDTALARRNSAWIEQVKPYARIDGITAINPIDFLLTVKELSKDMK